MSKVQKKGYFDYWRQRLHEELGKPDDGFAISLLNASAKNPNGASHQTLQRVLGKRISVSEEREEKLRYLLDVLQNDGYLVADGKRYRFRSSLLREFWLRRVAR